MDCATEQVMAVPQKLAYRREGKNFERKGGVMYDTGRGSATSCSSSFRYSCSSDGSCPITVVNGIRFDG